MKQLETSRSVFCQALVIWMDFSVRVPIFIRRLSLHFKESKTLQDLSKLFIYRRLPLQLRFHLSA